ncbi:MAG: hypothetical protein P8Z78_14840 [Gammaproteobacteria bacterium]|jgi:fatty acid desaturase
MDRLKLLLIAIIGLPISVFFLPTEIAGWVIIIWIGLFMFLIIVVRTALEDIALKGMGKKWRDED